MDTIRLSAVGSGSGSLGVHNSVCYQGSGHQGLHVTVFQSEALGHSAEAIGSFLVL